MFFNTKKFKTNVIGVMKILEIIADRNDGAKEMIKLFIKTSNFDTRKIRII